MVVKECHFYDVRLAASVLGSVLTGTHAGLLLKGFAEMKLITEACLLTQNGDRDGLIR